MLYSTLIVAMSLQLQAEVKDHLGSPTLFVGGKPRVPMIFFGFAGDMGPQPVQIGPEWRELHVTFRVPEDNPDHFGVQFRVGGGPPGTVWVDDVRVYPGAWREEVDPGENRLKQGGFEGSLEDVSAAWILFQRADQGADVSYALDTTEKTEGNQSLRIDIRGGGGNPMHAHFFQTGMTARKGEVYTYALKMRSAEPRYVDFFALHQGEPYRIYSSADNTPYTDQVKLAAAAGVHIHSFGIPMPWPRPGEAADFSGVDAAVDMTLDADPEALLLPRFGMGPPEWWHEEHPGNRMVFSDGREEYFCVASEAWRADFPEHLAALVRHCEDKYRDHMLGYHPCGQHTGEWFYERSWEPVVSDFSPAMRDGFRAWLREHYGSDERLREWWRDPAAEIDAAEIPTADELTHGTFGLFRDPATERRIIDYFEFKQLAMEEPLEEMARVIKAETNRRKLTVFFYGYIFDMHGIPMGPQHSGHLAMSRLLECPDVDILVSPISYLDRELGGAGMFMSAVDSVRAAGKLWLNEDDTRTYLTPADSGFGRVDTPQGTLWVHQRNFAQLVPRRLACWYMDLGGIGWLNGADIWGNIGHLRDLYEAEQDRPAQWTPEVVVIVDESAPWFTGAGRELHSPLVYEMRSQLFRMGMPFEIRLMSDLVAGRVPKAKGYIFLNAFHVDAHELGAIVRATYGAAAIWFYGAGLLDDGPAREVRAGWDMPNCGYTTGLPMIRGANQPGRITPVTGEPYGTDLVLDPLLAVREQEGVEVLGRYADGSAGAALEETQQGLRAYIGAVHCPASLLRAILVRARVHVWCDSDDVVLTDGSFLGVSATHAGEKTLHLPEPSTVTDLLTGEVLATDASSLTLTLTLGETRLLRVAE